MKKRVLILSNYYLPGVKGGGPIQSIKNIIDNTSNEIEYFVLTSDRDLGDSSPYKNICLNEWNFWGNAKIFYQDSNLMKIKVLIKVINESECDILYLNSFFNFKYSILIMLLRKIKKIKPINIVLAPRGEFDPGALSLKNKKKKLFIQITKILGLYNNITWHATANTEKKDIEHIFGNKTKIKVASNLTANYKNLIYKKTVEKKEGELKIVFISRIHPKKNLMAAIEFLRNIEGKVCFNIYGSLEDKFYWSECEKKIKELPKNISVNYKGIVDHDNVLEIFNNHHIFLFPTLGENFGHVISEAFIGGCPVIISDRTPWRDLKQQNVGWDIALENEEEFREVIQYCVNLDSKKYYELSKTAFDFGKLKSNTEEDINNTIKLFI